MSIIAADTIQDSESEPSLAYKIVTIVLLLLCCGQSFLLGLFRYDNVSELIGCIIAPITWLLVLIAVLSISKRFRTARVRYKVALYSAVIVLLAELPQTMALFSPMMGFIGLLQVFGVAVCFGSVIWLHARGFKDGAFADPVLFLTGVSLIGYMVTRWDRAKVPTLVAVCAFFAVVWASTPLTVEDEYKSNADKKTESAIHGTPLALHWGQTGIRE